jgi:phage shock protein PspC (stress-responsive transcriptional regulator)
MALPAPTGTMWGVDEPTNTVTTVRRWTRRATGRWFAGVASGLADGLDVDPWIVRFGFVVATLIGGVGVLAYVFLWWLLPRRDLPESAAQRMARRFPGAPTWLGVGLLVVGVMLFAGQLGWWHPSLVLAFLLVGLGVLLFRGQVSDRVEPPSAPGGGPPETTLAVDPPDPFATTVPLPTDEPPAAPSPPQEARERWFLGLVGGALALAFLALLRPVAFGRPADIAADFTLFFLAGILLVVGLVVRGRRPKERRRSFLFPLTIGVALLALGLAAILDQFGAISLTVGGGFALVLLVLGAGLVVGAWYGRARWLILPAIFLVPLALIATVITVPLDQGFGDRGFVVTRADQLPANYAIAGGSLRVDLTKLPPGVDPVSITAGIGAGNLRILVPVNAQVHVMGDVGAGTYSVGAVQHHKRYSIDSVGHSRGGVDMSIDETLQGGGGGPSIDLVVHVSVGQLQILRDTEAA